MLGKYQLNINWEIKQRVKDYSKRSLKHENKFHFMPWISFHTPVPEKMAIKKDVISNPIASNSGARVEFLSGFDHGMLL